MYVWIVLKHKFSCKTDAPNVMVAKVFNNAESAKKFADNLNAMSWPRSAGGNKYKYTVCRHKVS